MVGYIYAVVRGGEWALWNRFCFFLLSASKCTAVDRSRSLLSIVDNPNLRSKAVCSRWLHSYIYSAKFPLQVDKMNYDSCVINDTSQKMKILNCSKPNSTTAHYYTLLVRDFQPIPGIPDFTEGQSYYFICEYTPLNVAVHCVYTITCTHCEYTNHRMWQFSVCTPPLVLTVSTLTTECDFSVCTPSPVLTGSMLTTECDNSLCVHHHLYSLRSVSTLTAACDRWLCVHPYLYSPRLCTPWPTKTTACDNCQCGHTHLYSLYCISVSTLTTACDNTPSPVFTEICESTNRWMWQMTLCTPLKVLTKIWEYTDHCIWQLTVCTPLFVLTEIYQYIDHWMWQSTMCTP